MAEYDYVIYINVRDFILDEWKLLGWFDTWENVLKKLAKIKITKYQKLKIEKVMRHARR